MNEFMNNFNGKHTFPEIPNTFHNKVVCILNNLPEQKEYCKMESTNMKHKISFRKKATIALVAVMALATTAFAVGKVTSIVGHGSSQATYTEIPTVEQVNKEFDFAPKIVDEFINGYTFDNGYTSNNEAFDEQGNSVTTAKELSFEYVNGTDNVSLIMMNSADSRAMYDGTELQVVDTYSDTEIAYHSYMDKFVPVDYVMTEQDKKDEASGKYVFSVGSEEVEISKVQYADWTLDGVNYSLLAMDSQLSQNDLVEMAHQIIDAK